MRLPERNLFQAHLSLPSFRIAYHNDTKISVRFAPFAMDIMLHYFAEHRQLMVYYR